MSIYTILKLVAFVSMFIDHYGLVAGIKWMRVIGRLAMPIFAYFMGYGTRVSKHDGKRVIKLGITALISLPLTMITFNETKMNIMVTFFLFAFSMYFLKRINLEDKMWKHYLELLVILSLSAICGVFEFDYGWMLPILCYISYKSDSLEVVLFSYAALIFGYPYTTFGLKAKIYVNSFGVAALPLILWFMEKKDTVKQRKIYRSKLVTWLNRNIFYILYPLHVAVLLLIKIYLLG